MMQTDSSRQNNPDNADPALIRQVQAGEKAAFAALVSRYRETTCAIAYGYLHNWEDVQDAVQETFIQAYLRLGQLREPEHFTAWLRRITANVCLMMRRCKTDRIAEEAMLYEEIAARDQTDPMLAHIVVADALAKLPEKMRLVTSLYYLNELSHEEIAALLEIPVATVRSRLHQARAKLTKEMIGMVSNELQENIAKIRIRQPHIMQEELREPTGNAGQDDFLFGLINILRISLGELLRAIYRVDSYAMGDLLPLAFIFKAGHFHANDQKLWSLVTHSMYLGKWRYQVDPVYRGEEAPFYDATNPGEVGYYPCYPMLRLILKEHSLLLWGEDIRPRIALVTDRDVNVRDVLQPAFNWIKQAHNTGTSRLDQQIVYPLHDPAPRKADRGFGDSFAVTMRTFHMVRALIYMKNDQFILDHTQIADIYAEAVGGPWASFVRQAASLLEDELSAAQKRKLHLQLCRSMTDFENWFLQEVKESGVEVTEQVKW
jgi:RNA polymerase sigma-70 factor, ECF subfamily